MRSHKHAIKVAVRLRPLLEQFEDEEIWAVNSRRTQIYVTKNPAQVKDYTNIKDRAELHRRYGEAGPQNFTFDYVYGPDVRTSQIYQQIGRPIVQQVLNGYNGSIFMYGQTTSGKTYSMLGTPELPGILPCAIKNIFQSISQDVETQYTIWVSYLEIYNEQINDLLIPGSNNLKIKEDPVHGIAIEGLKQQQVQNFNQVIILMNYGEEHRSYRETNIHEHSSRSHTLFQVYIESKQMQDIEGRVKFSCLNLVDLAGSERINEFEVRGHNEMEETGHINRSLFILSNVVHKLADARGGHIPYRDSKLTRILQHSLGGNALSAIISTVSPASMNYNLTLSTLRFAMRAKTVQNKPEVNEILSDVATTNQYKAEIIQNKEEILSLKQQLEEAKAINSDMVTQLSGVQSGTEEISHELSELRQERDRERQRIIELESRLMASNAAEDNKQALAEMAQRYEEERRARKKLEQQLREQPEVSVRSDNDFLSDVIKNVNSQLQMTSDEQQTWEEEMNRLVHSWKYEQSRMQDAFLDSLLQIASGVIPDHVSSIQSILGFQPEPPAIQKESEVTIEEGLFEDIDFEFSPIIDDYLRSGQTSNDFADIIVNRLKEKHDIAAEALDERYRELYDAGHDLEQLKSAYETCSADLERQYVDALQQLDEYLGYVEYDDVEEALEDEDLSVQQAQEHASSVREETEPSNIQMMHAYLWGSGKDGRCGSGNEESLSRPNPLFSDKNTALNIQQIE